MRPNKADISSVETAACDGGGTVKERTTCFDLFAERTPGRTRGWSVICGVYRLKKCIRVKKGEEEQTNRKRAEIGLNLGVFERF